MSSEALTTVYIKTEVFWDVKPRSSVDMSHLLPLPPEQMSNNPEEVGGRFLQEVSSYLPKYTVPHQKLP
jgi:hypothetical protein